MGWQSHVAAAAALSAATGSGGESQRPRPYGPVTQAAARCLYALLPVTDARTLLPLLQEGSTTVAERVLRVSWPILPIGLVLSTAVCAFVLWRSAAQGGDAQYQQAVVAHGEGPECLWPG